MAKKKIPSASTEIELADGSVVPLSISWGLLLRVRGVSKDLYAKFSKLVTGGIGSDVLGALSVVYCGYLCAYIAENGSAAGSMSEEEFAENAPNDINAVTTAAVELIAPKAARDFKTRSGGGQTS